jgi:uncharacterized membrane protein YfcA
VPLVIGTVLGVMVIAHLDQHWMLPAIIAAIALSELAPWLAKRITKGAFQAALATGAYAGFLGAGIGIILVALFRLEHPQVEKIAHVKIQAQNLALFGTKLAQDKRFRGSDRPTFS